MQEGVPSEEILIDFVNYSGYDKVIYLFVNKLIMQQTGTIGSHTNSATEGGSFGTSIYIPMYEASLTMEAFLVDNSKIMRTATSSQTTDDKWLALKKAIREICPEFYPLF